MTLTSKTSNTVENMCACALAYTSERVIAGAKAPEAIAALGFAGVRRDFEYSAGVLRAKATLQEACARMRTSTNARVSRTRAWARTLWTRAPAQTPGLRLINIYTQGDGDARAKRTVYRAREPARWRIRAHWCAWSPAGPRYAQTSARMRACLARTTYRAAVSANIRPGGPLSPSSAAENPAFSLCLFLSLIRNPQTRQPQQVAFRFCWLRLFLSATGLCRSAARVWPVFQ